MAYIIKGGKVMSIGFSSEFTGCTDVWGKRAPSKHAEDSCLSNIKTIKRSMTLASVAFSFVNGTWYPTFARPCMHCTRLIMKAGIGSVLYSDYEGDLVKMRTDDLIKEATYSTGYRLHRGLGEHVQTVNLSDGKVFAAIKNEQLRIFPCTRTDFQIGMRINFMFDAGNGKRFICTREILGTRRYGTVRNLEKKEGTSIDFFRKKIDENGVIALHI